jgi:hypothetical protein
MPANPTSSAEVQPSPSSAPSAAFAHQRAGRYARSSPTPEQLGDLGACEAPPERRDRLDEQAPLVQAKTGVTVQLHPVSSLGLSGVSTSQPPRRPG